MKLFTLLLVISSCFGQMPGLILGGGSGSGGTTSVFNNQPNTYTGGGLQNFGSDNLKTTGIISLGETEPATVNQQDGPATVFSYAHSFPQSGGSYYFSNMNFMASGQTDTDGALPLNMDFYASAGTITNPVNAIAPTVLVELNGIEFLGGSYNYVASWMLEWSNDSVPEYGGGLAGRVQSQILSNAGAHVGDLMFWSPDAVAPELSIILHTGAGRAGGIGLSPSLNGVAEFNDGIPVASGGHLATLKLASGTQIAGTSTTPACTVSGDIGKFWFDTTTSTTAFKVCKAVSGTVGWSAVTTVP